MDCTDATLLNAGAPFTEADFIDAAGSMPGVIRVEPLDGDMVDRVLETEMSISVVSGGMRLDNRGALECASMGGRFAMFCDATFPRPDAVTMEMVDDRGELVGHDVPPGLRRAYEGRDDVCWLAEGFVLYPRRIGPHDVTMVMRSAGMRVPGVPENVEVRVFYPSPSSASLLGAPYGLDDGRVSAALVGVGGLRRRQFLGPM